MPDLNKSLGDEEGLDPMEDVGVEVQIGGAEHFGLHDEQEQIHQGKHFGLSLSLFLSLTPLQTFPSQRRKGLQLHSI